MVGRDAPLKFTSLFKAETKRWEVATSYFPEGQPSIVIGVEPLDEFPSELLIAQLMLVCG